MNGFLRRGVGSTTAASVGEAPGEYPADPGMQVKMAQGGLPGLAELAAGRPCDESELLALCDYVDARYDCADFRALVLVKVLCAWPELVSPAVRERIERTLLGFAYFADEPGTDAMCTWSENHQVIFAVTEYLTGQLFPERTFTSRPQDATAALTGRARAARAERRLRQWFADRFRYGFVEWLSPTYYEEDIAPLAVLIDHGRDETLVAEATMILDLILLDLALHSFRGRFTASAGRCYAEAKQDPAYADVNDVIRNVFGPSPDDPEPERAYDPARMSGLFVHRERYAVPPVIPAIAAAGPATIEASHGLDLTELSAQFTDPGDIMTTGLYAWAMQAFTTPQTIEVTMRAFRRWRMSGNAFLRGLAPFGRFAGTGLLPTLVRVLNPATQGVAIERADVRTVRTEHWQISAAQRYRPRHFGDQQHLWQVSLPRDVSVFATHPGRAMFDHTARNFSPSEWVGNGRNPDVVSTGNLLLADHDLAGRRGYLEPERAQFSHLWFPTERFDEVRRDARWLVGRVGESLVGVCTAEPLEAVRRHDAGPEEFRQHGRRTAWGVVCADTGSVSLAEFTDALAEQRLELTPDGASWHLDPRIADGHRRLVLPRDGVPMLDDQPVRTRFGRLHSPFGTVPRQPDEIQVIAEGHRLHLDLAAGRREIA